MTAYIGTEREDSIFASKYSSSVGKCPTAATTAPTAAKSSSTATTSQFASDIPGRPQLSRMPPSG